MASGNKIGLKNLATGESFELDMTPFTPETLWEAGWSENWDKLRSVLRPVLGRADFAVTDAVSQAFVDLVRRALDSSTSPVNGNTAVGVVVVCEVEGDDDVLKMLLEAGADPDIPNKEGWRASHTCGNFSRVEAAAVLFPCRPDMAATNPNGDTPLAAAQKKRYNVGETQLCFDIQQLLARTYCTCKSSKPRGTIVHVRRSSHVDQIAPLPSPLLPLLRRSICAQILYSLTEQAPHIYSTAASVVVVLRKRGTPVKTNAGEGKNLLRLQTDDDKFPARAARRPAVAKLITDNKYDQGAFPAIAELACHQKWFAVKNLVRRQVVPANEFGETFSGKTAAEWARIHKQDKMAQELEYYASQVKVKIAKTEQEKNKRDTTEQALFIETQFARTLRLEHELRD